ncbi:MAG: ornithine carbamoyltransferase [Thaumarchaeota archaeon]|nr:ornithine carbamoyltransferase [Nitrososphaerota archaeon]
MLKGRNILTLAELSSEEIIQILDLAHIMKSERNQKIFRKLLENHTLAMIFQKPSTRTRISFETAMFQLGGHAINLSANELQLSRGETIEDTARAISQYVDCVMARVYSHSDIATLAKAACIPVINGLSDWYHPCQILADLQTIREVKGRFQGLQVAWVGDGNNVCNTMLIASAKMGMDLAVACPPKHTPLPEAVKLAKRFSKETNAEVNITEDPGKAVKNADVVITDSFISMGTEPEREKRRKTFLPKYQVNRFLFSKAKSDAVFMHCLPAHRGEEVTGEVIDGPRSVIWQEAENRLHTQKALLSLLLLDEEAFPWPPITGPVTAKL